MAAVLVVVALVSILCITEVPLRTTTAAEQLRSEQAQAAAEALAAGTESAPRLSDRSDRIRTGVVERTDSVLDAETRQRSASRS